MAQSKPINKNSFYSQSETGGKRHIEMPPLPEENQQEQVKDNPIEVPQDIPEEVIQEVAPEESQELVKESASDKKEEVKPTQQDNFRSLREAKEKAERERDALLAQFLEAQTGKKPTQQEVKKMDIDDNIDFDIDEDGLVEGRYVKKVTNKLKALEDQLKNYQSQQKQQTIESRIKSQFPDFDKVVSEENVYLLNEQYPEIAQTLKDTSDLYNKAVSAYNVMKRFGIYKEDLHQSDRIRAEQNLKKPRPLTSASPQQGDSPLSHANAFANGLTDELKKQLQAEMFAARRKV